MTTKEFIKYLVRSCTAKPFAGSGNGTSLWIRYYVARGKFLIAGDGFPPTWYSAQELARLLDAWQTIADVIDGKEAIV